MSQHGVFSESEMRFYAAEVILGKCIYHHLKQQLTLGLEHMHNRTVVYRDLKVVMISYLPDQCYLAGKYTSG